MKKHKLRILLATMIFLTSYLSSCDDSWSKRSQEEMTYQKAFAYCEDLEEDGEKNWKLPDISELRSLILGCKTTENDGNCDISSNCINPYSSCEDDPCNGCGHKDNGYSDLGDRLPLLSGNWYDYYAESSDYAEFIATFSISVDYTNAGIHYKESGFVRCRKTSKGDTREVRCTDKPEHSQWKSETIATQTWDGKEWFPPYISTNNDTDEAQDCTFRCDNTYEWNEKTGTCDSTIVFPWTDPDTKLQWSSKKRIYNFDTAVSFCEEMNEGGNSDWRIPDITDLRTLITDCPATEQNGECDITLPCLDIECLNENCSGCQRDYFGVHSKLGDNHYVISSNNLSYNENDYLYQRFLYVNFLTGEILLQYQPSQEMEFEVFCRCVR